MKRAALLLGILVVASFIGCEPAYAQGGCGIGKACGGIDAAAQASAAAAQSDATQALADAATASASAARWGLIGAGTHQDTIVAADDEQVLIPCCPNQASYAPPITSAVQADALTIGFVPNGREVNLEYMAIAYAFNTTTAVDGWTVTARVVAADDGATLHTFGHALSKTNSSLSLFWDDTDATAPESYTATEDAILYCTFTSITDGGTVGDTTAYIGCSLFGYIQ